MPRGPITVARPCGMLAISGSRTAVCTAADRFLSYADGKYKDSRAGAILCPLLFAPKADILMQSSKNIENRGKMSGVPPGPMHVCNPGEEDFSSDLPCSPGEELANELTLYLQEIRRFPLLAADQEQHLARRIQHGLAEQKQAQPDHQIVADGKLAQRQLVEANYRLVVSVARRYLHYSLDLTLLDLIQEGNIGLIRCAPNFDPNRGNKFSTYAMWWIRQTMNRALENAGTIRLPVYISTQLRHIRQVRLQLLQSLGRNPVISELAVATGLDEARIEEVFSFFVAPLSLDQAYGAGSGEEPAVLGSLLADRNAVSVQGN